MLIDLWAQVSNVGNSPSTTENLRKHNGALLIIFMLEKENNLMLMSEEIWLEVNFYYSDAFKQS